MIFIIFIFLSFQAYPAEQLCIKRSVHSLTGNKFILDCKPIQSLKPIPIIDLSKPVKSFPKPKFTIRYDMLEGGEKENFSFDGEVYKAMLWEQHKIQRELTEKERKWLLIRLSKDIRAFL